MWPPRKRGSIALSENGSTLVGRWEAAFMTGIFVWIAFPSLSRLDAAWRCVTERRQINL